MINIIRYFTLILLLICFSCATKKDIKTKNKNTETEAYLQQDSDPFYPLKESISDIQNQVLALKSKVIEYESRLHAPSINIELLKLIKTPNLKHEITMTNGTKIQGTIIFENTEQMIVKTQIGQLTIEKEFVASIDEIVPLIPDVIFNEDKEIEERIQEDKSLTYVGEVINQGGRRADFVRVVYHFWADDTSPIFSDSCFVAGNSIIYLNGVISDASIEPAEAATFELNINLPDSLNIEYITKETSWSLFD